jgi:uncharacterized protein (TIGR00730 family)
MTPAAAVPTTTEPNITIFGNGHIEISILISPNPILSRCGAPHPPESGSNLAARLDRPAAIGDAQSMIERLKHICVYCGSSAGGDPVFRQAAESLGRTLAEAGVGLVYGGGNSGLMGAIARAVVTHGGNVTGIIPDFLEARELMFHEAQELVVVPDMHTRKRLMFERADAFVALPGGIGTLEELVEQLTWVQLGQHRKPVLLADIGGFWRPLLSLFAHMRQKGFIRPEFEVRYLVCEKIADILPMLATALTRVEAEGGRTENLNPRL